MVRDNRLSEALARGEDQSILGRGGRQAYQSLAILSVVYGLAGVDRLAIGLLAAPIKAELGLSDAQLGVITGFAFTLFYVTLAIPLGTYADRSNRKNIIVASVLLFSLAATLCGFAVGFLSLLLARLLVGVGEAGPHPASISIISSRFPANARPLAIAVHSAGGLLGVGFALLGIGMLAETLSWREILYLSGLLGVVVALLVAMFLEEPPREIPRVPPVGIWAALSGLARNSSYRRMAISIGFTIMIFGCTTSWIPSMLIRSFAFDRSEATVFMAVGVGFGGAIGSTLIGYLSTLIRSGAKGANSARPLLFAAVVNVTIGIGFLVAFAFSPRYEALALLIVSLMFVGAPIPILMALIQELVPAERRAITTATTVLIGNAIGYGLGPVITGLLSDWLTPFLGPDALLVAMSFVIAAAALLAALGCLAATRQIEEHRLPC